MPSGDPDHPILPKAWTYELVEIHLDWLAEPPFVELTFRRGEELRRLRFRRPNRLHFEPTPGHQGVVIKDLSDRGDEFDRVQVLDLEQENSISFWAADVEEVPLQA